MGKPLKRKAMLKAIQTAIRNSDLPIANVLPQFAKAIEQSPVVIVTSETGSGKSTIIPMWLMTKFKTVMCTQPRQLAARSLADFVSKQLKRPVGNIVGYRTGDDRRVSNKTKLTYCTDGLEWVKQLFGSVVNHEERCIVVDEVHEWNINVEALVAWTHYQYSIGNKVRLVLMSATMQADKLARYYQQVVKQPIPIVSAEGRLYPIKDYYRNESELVPSIVGLVNQNKNTLVFLPGKNQIEEVHEELRKKEVNAEILELHRKMKPEEQRRVFKQYARPKVILATNIAQTSITIEDVHAVVDSCLENKNELDEGIETLTIELCSWADRKQRMGRAGRCGPGIYIACCDTHVDGIEEFPDPQIKRVRLDQLVLRLAVQGFDATTLTFFHEFDDECLLQVRRAKRTLYALGATTQSMDVTQIGHDMAELPIEVEWARSIAQAARIGDPKLIGDVIIVSVLASVGSIRSYTRDLRVRPGWSYYTKEKNSDLLAELDIWRECGDAYEEFLAEEMHININNFNTARRRIKKLVKYLSKYLEIDFGYHDRKEILRCCCAGMVENLYRFTKEGYQNVSDSDEPLRKINHESIVKPGAQWVIGMPFNFKTRIKASMRKNRGEGGKKETHYVTRILCSVSKVDLNWLLEIAPQVTHIVKRDYYNPNKDAVYRSTEVKFNGQIVERESEKVVLNHPRSSELLADWLAEQMYVEC